MSALYHMHILTNAFVLGKSRHGSLLSAQLYETMSSILFRGVYYGQRACLPVRGKIETRCAGPSLL